MVILGFGRVENEERAKIKAALVDGARCGHAVPDILARWNNKADEYDRLLRGVAPERYTRVFCYDGELHFHHINRNHPLSPDGWALLQVDEPWLTAELVP